MADQEMITSTLRLTPEQFAKLKGLSKETKLPMGRILGILIEKAEREDIPEGFRKQIEMRVSWGVPEA